MLTHGHGAVNRCRRTVRGTLDRDAEEGAAAVDRASDGVSEFAPARRTYCYGHAKGSLVGTAGRVAREAEESIVCVSTASTANLPSWPPCGLLVAGKVNHAHASRPEGCDDLVRPEAGTACQRHFFFSSAVQLMTSVRGGDAFDTTSLMTRKRSPSEAAS